MRVGRVRILRKNVTGDVVGRCSRNEHIFGGLVVDENIRRRHDERNRGMGYGDIRVAEGKRGHEEE